MAKPSNLPRLQCPVPLDNQLDLVVEGRVHPIEVSCLEGTKGGLHVLDGLCHNVEVLGEEGSLEGQPFA